MKGLFAKLMIRDKLIMTLTDSGSSVNLINDPPYEQPGEQIQIIMCKKHIIVVNNGKLSVKGPIAIRVQLQKFATEITVQFLLTKIDITPCLLGIEFLYNLSLHNFN